MAIPYYRFFPGDYSRDTRHLSLMQHGVYRLLIDLYMDHGQPLRNDLPWLYRWLHAESVEEKNAVEFVLGEFFIKNGETWTHKRCDFELEWRQGKSKKARTSIEKRWKNNGNTDEIRTYNERNTNQNQNQNQKKRKASATVPVAGFENFWAAYPRKEAKPRAIAAWNKLQPDEALLAKMLAAVAVWRTSERWTSDGGKYCPHPATWLNERRWEDEMPQQRRISYA